MLSPARVVQVVRPAADANWAHGLAGVLGWTPLGGGRYGAGEVTVAFREEGSADSTGEAGLDPACELEVAPADFDGTLRRLCDLLGRTREDVAGSVAWDARGASFSFYDPAGNLTTLLQPTWRARTGRTGRTLGRLLGAGTEGGAGGGAPVVGVTLHVSSLPRALRLYRVALELPPLRVTPREARFDAGPVILSLRAERQVGMVADAARRGALRGTTVFRVRDLDEEAAALSARGIGCRAGEDGTAWFRDPDGHRLLLAAGNADGSPPPARARSGARGAAIHESRLALEAR